VPRISEFFGIAVYIYYREHEPPHFHAIYQGDEVLVAIDGLSTLRGLLPPRAMGMVIEWAARHRDELLATGSEPPRTSRSCRLNH
jgi:hypothetical protein